ncbi:MAG: DnaD domain-containing protein [Chloroflexota bacterium]
MMTADDRRGVGADDDPDATILPGTFFTVLLPGIESMEELKTTLFVRRLLTRRAAPRAVSLGRLEADRLLLRALKPVPGPRPAEEMLREGLEFAVTRGSLLHLRLGDSPESSRRWYLLNTPENQELLRRLGRGEIGPSDVLGEEVGAVDVVRVYRPNIFTLYEQMIGVLTPTVADGLRDAEQAYPAEWLTDALGLAVEYNKRSWGYVQGILKRWETEGRSSGTDRGHSEAPLDSEKYTSGRYGRLVES